MSGGRRGLARTIGAGIAALALGSVVAWAAGGEWRSASLSSEPGPAGGPAGTAILAPSPPEPSCRGANRIAAPGLVEPLGGLVTLHAETQGVVTEVLVSPGDRVLAGAPLIRLDAAAAADQLTLRRHDLAIAKARLAALEGARREARAELDRADARLVASRVDLSEAEDVANRSEQLAGGAHVSQRERQKRRFAAARAMAQVAEAMAAREKAAALHDALDDADGAHRLAIETATVARAQAALAIAEAALARTEIRAPSDLRVLQVAARVGERLRPDGPSALVVAPVDLWSVRVEIDALDLGRFHSGAVVEAQRRRPGAEATPLTFHRLDPLVAATSLLAGESDEPVDRRVAWAHYRLDAEGYLAGEVLDVMLYLGCADG